MNEREARANVLPFRPHVSNVVPIDRRLRVAPVLHVLDTTSPPVGTDNESERVPWDGRFQGKAGGDDLGSAA